MRCEKDLACACSLSTVSHLHVPAGVPEVLVRGRLLGAGTPQALPVLDLFSFIGESTASVPHRGLSVSRFTTCPGRAGRGFQAPGSFPGRLAGPAFV